MFTIYHLSEKHYVHFLERSVQGYVTPLLENKHKIVDLLKKNMNLVGVDSNVSDILNKRVKMNSIKCQDPFNLFIH